MFLRISRNSQENNNKIRSLFFNEAEAMRPTTSTLRTPFFIEQLEKTEQFC